MFNGCCKGNHGFTTCTVKNILGGCIRNAVGLNCHFYVMEATFGKQTYVFSKLWLCSSKRGQKDVSSIGPHTTNPFTLEGYQWVMLSVLSCVFSVAFWSSFCLCTYYHILYFFTSKSNTFFVATSYKRLGVGESWHFRLQLSVKSLELKYYFDHECKMNPLLST